MSEPTEVVIWDVVGALMVKFREALGEMQVLPGWPGETIEDKTVWISEIAATSREVPGFVGETRVLMDETYDVKFRVEVHDEVDADDTQAALALIIGKLDSAVREDPRIGETPGLIECLFTTPFEWTVGYAPDGCHGYAQLNLEVRTRLY